MEIGVKNKIFSKTSTSDAHLYSNQDLRKLLVPIIVEQLLSSLMGTADTMMVSNVGSAAISAVSLVDSINILEKRKDVPLAIKTVVNSIFAPVLLILSLLL